MKQTNTLQTTTKPTDAGHTGERVLQLACSLAELRGLLAPVNESGRFDVDELDDEAFEVAAELALTIRMDAHSLMCADAKRWRKLAALAIKLDARLNDARELTAAEFEALQQMLAPSVGG